MSRNIQSSSQYLRAILITGTSQGRSQGTLLPSFPIKVEAQRNGWAYSSTTVLLLLLLLQLLNIL